jgi:hypothetical protein
MAGLGGACSHVGAVLFFLEVNTLHKANTSCTSKENMWLRPRCSEVPISEVRACDYTSADRQYKKLKGELSDAAPSRKPFMVRNDLAVTDEELHVFLNNVEEDYPHSAIFSVAPHFYQSRVIPEKTTCGLIKPLTDLHDKEAVHLSYDELFERCVAAFESLKISADESAAVEEATRGQSKNPLWHKYRAGVISGSNMHEVLSCDISNLNPRLIKRICYPESQPELTKGAAAYGKKMERPALIAYTKAMQEAHEDFMVKECGFSLCVPHRYIGASADGFVLCLCHGVGVVEIKNSTTDEDDVCGLLNGKLQRNHRYYAQVQTELLSCDMYYCDFVVARPSGRQTIQRIRRDEDFLKRIIDKGAAVCKVGILPELIGLFYSSNSYILCERVKKNMPTKSICYCNGAPESPMINCISPNCAILTFHWKCVNVKKFRKRWFCPDCLKAK